jgi:sulfite reductase (NADPH) hemoprotein beta-component
VPLELPPQPVPVPRRAPLAQVASLEPGYAEWAADSVRPQKQSGFSAIVIRLILGDITSSQMRSLATIAQQYGEGEVRLTNEQNIVLRWVPDARLPSLHRELARIGLAKTGANTLADVTSCPGATSCKLAVTSSKGLAGVLTELLDRRPELGRVAGLDIKISGCPHGCGQHYIAGIGFQGGMRKLAGRPAPQYLVYVGGGITSERAEFGRLVTKVPARKAGLALERLIEYYVANGGTSHAFWSAQPLDKLRELLADVAELADTDATEADFVDIGADRAFEVISGEGECSA